MSWCTSYTAPMPPQAIRRLIVYLPASVSPTRGSPSGISSAAVDTAPSYSRNASAAVSPHPIGLFYRDIRSRRIAHAAPDLERRVRGLIVGRVLPRDGDAVLRVVHQRVDAA